MRKYSLDKKRAIPPMYDIKTQELREAIFRGLNFNQLNWSFKFKF